jgi:hypothetical protein
MSHRKRRFSDQEVIEAIKGNLYVSEATTFLYEHYYDFCVGHLPAALKDDAYQEIMMAFVAWVRQPNFQLYDDTKLSTCLYGLAHRVLLRLYRSEQLYHLRLARYALLLTESQVAQIEVTDAKEAFYALGQLSEEEQQLIAQYELRGEQRVEALAKELGLSKNALVMRVTRIKERFMILCEDYGII